MTTTNLFEGAARWGRLFAAALLAAILCACGGGVGTGGTGGGPVGASTFSGSALASGTPIPPAPIACLSACDQVTLVLDEARVELVVGCGRFLYNGSFTLDAGGEVRLTGTLQANGTASAATLSLRLADGNSSTRATVELTGEGGVVLAPLVLPRTEAGVSQPVPSCP